MLTLAETKLHLRVDHNDEDALIEALMTTATAACADYLNARATGRSHVSVLQEAQAGKVVSQLTTVSLADLQAKTQHLAAIHALPSECWPDAVQTMLDKGWSAKETGEQVKAASEAGSAKVICALLAGSTSPRKLPCLR